jgi:hypothetical protein
VDELSATQLRETGDLGTEALSEWLLRRHSSFTQEREPIGADLAVALSTHSSRTVAGPLGYLAIPLAAQLNLLEHDDSWGRSAMAANPTTAPEVLGELARDPEARIREQVARRRDLTPDVVDLLAADELDVVKALASNPLAAHHLPHFERLGGFVLVASSANPALAPLDQRARAADPEHHRALAQNRSLDPGVARLVSATPKAHESLSRNPVTPEDVLLHLARTSTSEKVLERLSQRGTQEGKLPVPALHAALAARKGEHRRDLAANPDLSEELMRQLHRTWDGSGSCSPVGYNPNCPPDLLAEVLTSARTPMYLLRELSKRSGLSEGSVRVLAASPRTHNARALAESNPWLLGQPLLLRPHFLEAAAPEVFAEATSRLDPDTLAALLPTWPGTLGELMAACEELGPASV